MTHNPFVRFPESPLRASLLGGARSRYLHETGGHANEMKFAMEKEGARWRRWSSKLAAALRSD